MALRSKDLMIGDWVRGFVPDSNSTIYGIFNEQRIAIIAEPSKAYIELSIDDIQPIPLTPEILEKNGFECRKLSSMLFFYILSDDYYDIEVSEISDSIWYVEYTNTEMPDIPGLSVNIAFVHEFQHAFRILGIDKEILL